MKILFAKVKEMLEMSKDYSEYNYCNAIDEIRGDKCDISYTEYHQQKAKNEQKLYRKQGIIGFIAMLICVASACIFGSFVDFSAGISFLKVIFSFFIAVAIMLLFYIYSVMEDYRYACQEEKKYLDRTNRYIENFKQTKAYLKHCEESLNQDKALLTQLEQCKEDPELFDNFVTENKNLLDNLSEYFYGYSFSQSEELSCK